MIESKVIRCLKQIDSIKDMLCIVESENGVHPMDRSFILVGKIYEHDEGTPSQTLTSRNGKWYKSQTVSAKVTIGVQGRKTNEVSEECTNLKELMSIDPIRYIFSDAGYTYVLGTEIQKLVIPINTSQYMRYWFEVKFKTHRWIEYTQPTIDSVELTGTLLDGDKLHKYTEDIPQ